MKKLQLIVYGSLILIISSCKKSEIKETYWDIKNKHIRWKLSVSGNVVDGICYSFYPNGKTRSITRYDNGRLMHIVKVNDTTGKKMNWGFLHEGNGHVKIYNEEFGYLDKEGDFVDGMRDGWWKRYLWNGRLFDSIYYDNGIGEGGSLDLYLLY